MLGSALDTRTCYVLYIYRMDQFAQALETFVAKLQAAQDAYSAKHYPNSRKNVYAIDPKGLKYVRITVQMGSQLMVYCFVERSTGHILKAASFKAPAKGARGSIYNANPLEGCGPHGVAYLNHPIQGFDGHTVYADAVNVTPAPKI